MESGERSVSKTMYQLDRGPPVYSGFFFSIRGRSGVKRVPRGARWMWRGQGAQFCLPLLASRGHISSGFIVSGWLVHRVAGKKKWVNGSGSLERDTRRPRWGGLEREERRHVRGRRMFYGFIICRVVSPRAEERFLYFPLIFLLFFFFLRSLDVESRARNRKRRADSRLDDR